MLGDFAPSTVLNTKFCTRVSGVPTTLAGTPAVSVYKDDSTTQSTAGVTLTQDFDGVTGMHNVAIDTSADGTFYAAGSVFQIVVTAGTCGGFSIVGHVVDSFSIHKAAALRPTTAGRTLAVDASGLADANVVKVGPSGSGTAQTARDLGASVLVGDKTGFALTSAYDAAKTAAQAGDAMTLTSAYDAAKTAAQAGDIPTADDNALTHLKYDWDGITGEPSHCALNAHRSTRNDWSTTAAAGKRRVYKEDGTTTAFDQTLVTDVDGIPITGAHD